MITDNEILDLIDGRLADRPAKDLMDQINANPELERRYLSLKNVDSLLKNQSLPEVSSNFTDRVMKNLNKKLSPEITRAGVFSIKNLIFAIGIILLCFVAGIVLLSQFSLSTLLPEISPQEISLQERTLRLDPGKLNFDQELFFKGFIYLNAFLGLFLFERAILRPFFKQRREQYSY